MADDAEVDPQKQGWLQKQGQYIKTWRSRYCVLKKGILFYYKDLTQQDVPTNRFRLRNAKVETRPENRFDLVFPSGLRRSLKAATQQELDEWVTLLRQSIGFRRKRKQVVKTDSGEKTIIEVEDDAIADHEVDDYDDEYDHDMTPDEKAAAS